MAMSSLALILVISAHITAAQNAPDLPDDFNKSGEVSAAVPTITFATVASSSSQVVRTKGTKKVSERFLVSESWCSQCPAEKARFKSSGGDDDHIVTIAEAKRRHGKHFSSVPAYYTIEAVTEVEFIQPATYRSTSRMQTTLNGSAAPGKSAILNHLRTGGPHQKKHWQRWHLESWKTEQLYALHDDDHAGNVPEFADESAVEATITNARASPSVIAAALSAHLIPDKSPQAYAGLFDITIDTPDNARVWIASLLSRQSVEFPSAGVSATWKGSDRTISVTPGAIRIAPGVTVSVKKFGIEVSTTMNAVAFAEDLSWVRLELTNSPDLTVRFR